MVRLSFFSIREIKDRRIQTAQRNKSGQVFMEQKTDTPRPLIFIVDDEKGLLGVIKIQLSKKYEVVASTSPIEALGGIKKRIMANDARSRPRLLISDIKMEEMNGIDFVKAVRALDSTLPIILMTAYELDPSWQQELPWLTSKDYLQKPFGVVQLERSIEAHL